MVSRVQRLGGGPDSAVRLGFGDGVGGPAWRRSVSCCWSDWSESKRPPTVTTVLVGAQTGEPLLLVEREPGVDGVGIAGAEEAEAGDGVRRLTVGDLEQGGTAFADVGLGVVVTLLLEFVILLWRQG
jgi:hypothetical protein